MTVVSVIRPVALLLPTLAGGGAERSVLSTAGALLSRGHAVDLVVGSADGPLRVEVPPGVDLHDLGVARVRSVVGPLRRYLGSRRPTHLVPTLEHAVVAAAAAVRLERTDTVLVPRVANTVSEVLARTTAVDRAAHRLAVAVYRRAATVVAVSQGVADDLIASHGVPGDRVRVVPNPVVPPDLERRRSAPASHPWAHADGPPLVVGMGRLCPQKNFALLLRAFAEVVVRRPARLVILGEGELRAPLEHLVQQLGLAEVVDLPGFLPDPFPVLGAAHVFVLSSDHEGMPGALIQAIACGATPVATDCPSGPREVLSEVAGGHLVPRRDVPAMREAILTALDAPRAGLGPDVWGRWTAERSGAGWAAALGLEGAAGARQAALGAV